MSLFTQHYSDYGIVQLSKTNKQLDLTDYSNVYVFLWPFNENPKKTELQNKK